MVVWIAISLQRMNIYIRLFTGICTTRLVLHTLWGMELKETRQVVTFHR